MRLPRLLSTSRTTDPRPLAIWRLAAGACALLATVCLAVLDAPAQLATKTTLTLDAARQIAAAAEKEARANKWNVVIAIVDDGANLLYLQRMDETQIGSIEVAQEKARTAVNFK